jgi:hypothetical protein
MGTAKSGNRTTGRAALVGGYGNKTPIALRSLPRDASVRTAADNATNTPNAPDVVNQYNAESTYNQWSNQRAAGHLNDLAGHLQNLFEATQNRQAYMAKSRVTEAQALSTRSGFTAHPDIIGDESRPGSIHEVIDKLKNIMPDSIADTARPHLNAALNSAQSVLGEFHPAAFSEFKEFGSDPTRVSVEVAPEFRANSFDYARPKEESSKAKKASDADWKKQMMATADGKYALRAQGQISDPEKGRSAESKARKAERRKQLAAERKAAQGGAK